MDADLPLIVSPDDHVIEPAHLWHDRLPKKFLEAGPRVVTRPRDFATFDPTTSAFKYQGGTDGPPVSFWLFEDLIKPLRRNEAAAGFDADFADDSPTSFDEIRPGCWQPKARLADMDINGVEASMCFPNFPRFAGQIFSEGEDRELGLACIKAYNDWMVDEWCGQSGGRLIPLTIVPLWDAELAAAEVRRNADRGVRAVSFSENPAWLGAASIHSGEWDPLFDACNATGTVLAMHIGSGSRVMNSSADAPSAVKVVMIFNNSAMSLVDYLSSGLLSRFPNLKLFFAEAQMGWIPYVLERADDLFVRERWRFPDSVIEPPSTYYRHHVFSCFYSDPAGVAQLERVGVDQVMFETDYPHGSGTWPRSKAIAESEIGHLDPAVQRKLLRDNAIKLFGLEL
jgi:predicted TIM-barrel fold metal-dependent hydrolase